MVSTSALVSPDGEKPVWRENPESDILAIGSRPMVGGISLFRLGLVLG
jgi:hypothetical protein